jgi:carbon-monoxide dehydrogenase small subunit
MTSIAITLNGQNVTAEVQPRTHLGDFLRDSQRLSGTHLGCEHGICGACTVLLNGAPARSCITLAVACDGMEVTTIEGFDNDDTMSDLRAAFTKEHGLQCGFCTPGMLIAARDIVRRLPDADERRIREELSGNLCRCTGYVGIVNAVASVIEKGGKEGTHADAQSQSLHRTAALTPFVPAEIALPVALVTEAPVAGVGRDQLPSSRQGWSRFEESFVIAQPRERVWEFFGDIPSVAACLPGTQVLSHDERTVKGRMTAKLGPIAASFAGSAVIERDPPTWSGTVVGAGSEGGSGSRTKGEISYRLEPVDEGAATHVAVAVVYNLQGPLAQFSRSSLAHEFGRHLVNQFAANLSASLSGAAPPPQATEGSLNIARVLWSVVKSWMLGLSNHR